MSSNQAKRTKNNDAAPSKVVHIRGLPSYPSEAEVMQICAPFGTVEKVLVLGQSHQAFVQMHSVSAAENLIARYSMSPAVVRGKAVYIQYSTHSELNTESKQTAEYTATNHILLVTVLNQKIPVTIDHLYTIFKPYGEVRKIIIFNNKEFRALVQMGTADSAARAKSYLEGKDMFQGCCHLRIAFSNLQDLAVTEDSPRARDFTKHHTTGPLFPGLSSSSTSSYFSSASSFGGNAMAAAGSGVSPADIGEPGSVLIVSKLPEERPVTCDMLFMLFGVYGDVLRVKILYKQRSTAFVQFISAIHAQRALKYLRNVMFYDNELSLNVSKHSHISLPRGAEEEEASNLTKDYSNSPVHRFRNRAENKSPVHPPSPVLHVSNLPDSANEDELRHMFANDHGYAPVVQMWSHAGRRQSLVKFNTIRDAVLSLMHWHNHKLREKYMRVSFSPKDPSAVRDTHGEVGMGDGEHETGDY